MTVRDLKDRFMAHPWVYDTIRPFFIGYIDHEHLGRFCGVRPEDRVFDLGCGTAQLLSHIRCDRYLGADLDTAALERAQRRSAPNVRFVAGNDWDAEYRALDPTLVLMIGVVHHVSDEIFGAIVRRLRAGARAAPRLVTFEATYFPGYPLSNLLSRLDRGRHVRTPEQYDALFSRQGLSVTHREVLPTQWRIARYIGYHMQFA
jgi:SAM-dependent methyltransferase